MKIPWKFLTLCKGLIILVFLPALAAQLLNLIDPMIGERSKMKPEDIIYVNGGSI